ncbi:MAG TPA: hypothetical protein ENK13_01255, partial [Thermopetrobacter sp.]|nr:hypothetical protein [Thermopetrobacter sp.]
APMTVLNFVTLAEGGSEWTDPRTGRPTRRPLYRDLVFHRVRDFMIQTGDPTGTGRGGSGREFDDEFHPDLRFDRPGMVAMANRGPNTNSSQFFITTRPAPWLNDHHTIFGEVVSGLEVVRSIRQGDRLKGITIIRRGADARAFDAARAHELAKARRAALRRAACKSVPEARAPLDPARVPKPDQPLRSPGSFEFLVIGHNQIRDLPRLGRVFCYDREEALKLARRLVRLARGRGVDFSDLVRRYTDMRHNTRAVNVARSPLDPVALQQIFRLAPGQISDPVDLPGGIYVFRRLD